MTKPDKKLSLLLSSELYKAAKLKAAHDDLTLTDWVLALIHRELQEAHPSEALNLGRIDSRIDLRTASLQQQVDSLAEKLESILKECRSSAQSNDSVLFSRSGV